MAHSTLSNFSYVLHFTSEQMQDYQQLLLLGSCMSELLEDRTKPGPVGVDLFSMQEWFKHCVQQTELGVKMAEQWSETLQRLSTVVSQRTTLH